MGRVVTQPPRRKRTILDRFCDRLAGAMEVIMLAMSVVAMAVPIVLFILCWVASLLLPVLLVIALLKFIF